MRASPKMTVSEHAVQPGFYPVLYVPALIPEDFMEAEEGEESDDGGHGDMRNLHLNDDPDQFADD